MRPDNAVTLNQGGTSRVVPHARTQASHTSHHLVTEDDGQMQTAASAQLSLPQMHIRAANRRCFDLDQDGAWFQGLRNRHLANLQRLLECHHAGSAAHFRYGAHTSSSSE